MFNEIQIVGIPLVTLVIIAVLLIAVFMAFFFLGDAAFFLLTEHHRADRRMIMSKVFNMTACLCVIWFVTMFLIVLLATSIYAPHFF